MNVLATDGIEPGPLAPNPGLSSTSSAAGVIKRKRNLRACDRCHRNACRCSPGAHGMSCSRCEEQGVECTYNRPIKRRGPPSRRLRRTSDSPPDSAADPPPAEPASIAHSRSPMTPKSPHANPQDNLPPSSAYYAAYENVIKPDMINSLMDVFYYTAYPLRPYFHWPTFSAQVQQQAYRHDWGIFIMTMAVCALAAGRLCDGVVPFSPDPHPLRPEAGKLSAECYAAAVNAIPSDITGITDYYPVMRAKAILGSTCAQSGNIKQAVAHLGDYVTLSASNRFYDESHWPSNLNKIEIQERRRLFWGVYQQDQYVANNFGYVPRQREARATVLYPAEVFDDEDITATSIHIRSDRVSFLRGWNFCTDLYRLLEHMDDAVRARQQVSPQEPGGLMTTFLSRFQLPRTFAGDSLHLVSQLHQDLPQELKRIKAMTGDPQIDRYGYIASNILLTTQTLKMLLVGTEKPSVHQRCAIAGELLDELSAIPLAFFHASSTVTLHHLAHVGHLLGSVNQNPLPPWTYLQIRNILLVLADFLDKIESARLSTPGLATKLRVQIGKIDRSMEHASKNNRETGLLLMSQTLLSGLPSSTSPGSGDRLAEQQPSQPCSMGNAESSPQIHPVPSQSIHTIPATDSQLSQGTMHQSQEVLSDHNIFPAAPESLLGCNGDDTQHLTNSTVGSSVLQSEHQSSLFSNLFDDWPLLFGQGETFSLGTSQ